MDELLYFNTGKEKISNFFDREFPGLPQLIKSHFFSAYNDLMNYQEEGKSIKPIIVLTDNIDAVVRAIPKSYSLPIFKDPDASSFRARMKSILAIVRSDWCLYINVNEGKVEYGVIMWFGSIKDKSFLLQLQENSALKERTKKVCCIAITPLSLYTMMFYSVSGNNLAVNFSLEKTTINFNMEEVKMLVDATFSKLRTTQRKLQDMKNLYLNIFTNVMHHVNGTICVIVDKDYQDNGLFEDGIWLQEPISFSKLFSQSKSYSEEKLQAYADLLINMLNFDGITIIDNLGRLRAYNVFVEANNKKVGHVVGGARKRAAYCILNARKRDIIGVYFQSHEGEVIYQEVKKTFTKKAPANNNPQQLTLQI